MCLLQYGLDRILGEEKSLALLARAIDPNQSAMMTDVVKLLSAICIVGEENTYVLAILFFFSTPFLISRNIFDLIHTQSIAGHLGKIDKKENNVVVSVSGESL